MDELAEPGDYCYRPGSDGVWFFLPVVQECPPGEREVVQVSWDMFWRKHHRVPVGSPEGWALTEESDGTITLSPSIQTWCPLDGGRLVPTWHGYLKHGTWETL